MSSPLLQPSYSREPLIGRDGLPIRNYKMHRIQHELLMREERYKILVAGRRMGKSHVAAIWCLMRGQQAQRERKKGLIWIVYPVFNNAQVAWKKFFALAPKGWITGFAGSIERPISITMGDIRYEFKSGASATTLVGEGLLALWIDECGMIDSKVWNEYLYPTLIDFTAPVLMTGTPKGHNWFYDMFVKGRSPEYADHLTWSDGPKRGVSSFRNPFIPKENIEAMATEMPETMFRQEILAEFIEGTGYFKIYDAEQHLMCLANDVGAKRLGITLDSKGCSTQRTACLGIDLARTKDFTVIIGCDRDGYVTYIDRFRDLDWPIQKDRINRAWEKVGKPPIIIDATGVGDPVTQDLKHRGIFTIPFVFGGRSKVDLFEQLHMAFDEGKVKIPDRRHPLSEMLIHELSIFEVNHTSGGHMTLSAPSGKHDDMCCALALAYKGAMRYQGEPGISF